MMAGKAGHHWKTRRQLRPWRHRAASPRQPPTGRLRLRHPLFCDAMVDRARTVGKPGAEPLRDPSNATAGDRRTRIAAPPAKARYHGPDHVLPSRRARPIGQKKGSFAMAYRAAACLLPRRSRAGIGDRRRLRHGAIRRLQSQPRQEQPNEQAAAAAAVTITPAPGTVYHPAAAGEDEVLLFG